MEPQDNIQKYLPSKKFQARILIVIILLILALCIYSITSYFNNRLGRNGETALIVKPEVIQKDSNNNTIPDWEESLWGLDPLKDGASNKEFILAKRETLAKENGLMASVNQPLSENETLSREFFSIIMSLQESGDLNQTAMDSIAKTIGEKITATPIPDIYTKDMLSTIKANPSTTSAYSNAILSVLNKYNDKDIGKELIFVSVGLTNNDPGALSQAEIIGSAYKALGKDLMKIQVPNTFSTTHLSLANSYEKVGISIDGLGQMLDDPIIAMKAVINYKKYTDMLVANMETLSKNLE